MQGEINSISIVDPKANEWNFPWKPLCLDLYQISV